MDKQVRSNEDKKVLKIDKYYVSFDLTEYKENFEKLTSQQKGSLQDSLGKLSNSFGASLFLRSPNILACINYSNTEQLNKDIESFSSSVESLIKKRLKLD